MRRAAVVLAALAALFSGLPAIGAATEDRVQSATVDGMTFNVVLPEGYDPSDRRYPVLYLLHPFNEDQDSWLLHSDLLALTAREDVIVVLPDAGNIAGIVVDGRDGSCRGETQVMQGVIPYVDAHFRTVADRGHRAIAGASSGAFSALHLGARNPDSFVAAASLSGPPDVTLGASPVGEAYFFGAEREAVFECGGNMLTGGLFGTPIVDEVWVRNANPADLAPNFGGMEVYVGDGNGLPCDLRDLPDLPRASFTAVTRRSSESFLAALGRVGVPATGDLRSCGLHSWRYFGEFLHASWPRMESAFGRQAPADFDHRQVEPYFTVWGWSFHADPERAPEFLDVTDASRDGVTLTGSGTQGVSTAAYFTPGQTVRVETDSSATEVVADREGRISFDVDLGTPHQQQQYRDPLAESSPTYFTTRTVRFVAQEGS